MSAPYLHNKAKQERKKCISIKLDFTSMNLYNNRHDRDRQKLSSIKYTTRYIA